MQHSKKLDRLQDADLDTKPVAAMSESAGSLTAGITSDDTGPGSGAAASGHAFMGCRTELESRNARQFQDRRARHEESHHSPI